MYVCGMLNLANDGELNQDFLNQDLLNQDLLDQDLLNQLWAPISWHSSASVCYC